MLKRGDSSINTLSSLQARPLWAEERSKILPAAVQVCRRRLTVLPSGATRAANVNDTCRTSSATAAKQQHLRAAAIPSMLLLCQQLEAPAICDLPVLPQQYLL